MAFLLLMLASIAMAVDTCAGSKIFRHPGQGDSVLLLLGLTTTMIAALRVWPVQNCVVIACGLGAIGWGAHLLSSRFGFPFGSISFSATSATTFRPGSSWFIPWLWIVVVLNSRGTAQCILRPWHKRRTFNSHYGYWLLIVTVLLAVIFDLALEGYAVNVGQYWAWPSAFAQAGFPAPWTNAAGWALTTIVTLLYSLPGS